MSPLRVGLIGCGFIGRFHSRALRGLIGRDLVDAEYAAVIEIDLAEITEPIVCCPNDPDDAKLLSEVAGDTVDEVFIGSCMTNIGHFRAAGKLLAGKKDLPTRLWIAPPTKMDEMVLREEGVYSVLGTSGARVETPGCSLCMGNQAQTRKGATAISTSTVTWTSAWPKCTKARTPTR